MSVSFFSLRNSRVHLQNYSFILRKEVENLRDMGYQKILQNTYFERSLFTLRGPAFVKKDV